MERIAQAKQSAGISGRCASASILYRLGLVQLSDLFGQLTLNLKDCTLKIEYQGNARSMYEIPTNPTLQNCQQSFNSL